MQPADVRFSCTCGQVCGVIHDVSPRTGNHMKCYCTSCQTAARVLGDPMALDAHGGTTVYQTVPSKITFDSGVNRLACLKLSPKGLLRWYASCCGAALFTMPDASWFAIAGLNTARVSARDQGAFGPLVGIHRASDAIDPPADLKSWGNKRAIARVIWRAFKARVRRDSTAPFFTKAGKVSVTPRVLTLEQRKAAMPDKA